MRRRQLALRLLVPALLVGLVGWLAALEYHWLDQVSQADREQRRAWLEQHASEFADDVDRELARLYGFLQTAGDSEQLAPDFATRYEVWRDGSADPQIVRAIYWAKNAGESSTLSEYDPGHRSFRDVPWPDTLTPVAAQLRSAATAGDVGFVSMLGVNPVGPLSLMPDPISASIPAVIVARTRSNLRHLTPEGTNTVVAVTDSSEVLIAQLDRAYLEGTFLPGLAARHFPAHSVDSYRVAVVDAHNPAVVLMTSNWPAGTPIDLRRADATQPLFTLRPELAPRAFSVGPIITQRVAGGRITAAGAGGGRGGSTPSASTGTAQSTFRLVVETDRSKQGTSAASAVRMYGRPVGWQLVLQHASGSLDVAVTEARHRNLWLSFGLLAVLSAGIVLIVTNAQRSERLATQQMDFVATVSHELRTPLAVIRSAAQNLGAGVVADPARARQYGDLIEAEGRRLTDIVEQVLEYAGVTGAARPPTPTPVDVGTIAAEVLAACEPLASAAGVQVESNLAAGLPVVLGDERALRSAIQNLVTNALKYGADGHWLGVSVQARGRPNPTIEVTVADRGLGIDAEDRRHLFEPFYRGRRAIAAQARGNGLGLSLVKRIAEAHGGRIRVESAPGAGATFQLTLPASPAATTADLAGFRAGPATE